MSKIDSKQIKMFSKQVLFVISAIFTYCESAAIVDSIKKCGFNDDACQRELYRSIVLEVANSGIPEMGIPIIDPFEVKDMEIIAMGLVKIGMPSGVFKGYKTCQSNSFHTDTEKLITSIEMVCEHFTFEGQYKVEATPTLSALIGGIKLHGEGKTTLDIENIQLNLEVPFEIKKLEDCELHVVMDADKIISSYKILGKATVAADNLYVGSQEISSVAVNIFNENWEFISNTMAKPLVDKALEVFVENANKFFANVPMKDLVTDDVSGYVTQ